MRDILTTQRIGGGILVASVLLTNFVTVPGQSNYLLPTGFNQWSVPSVKVWPAI